MSSSVLEDIRQRHEDIESLEKTAALLFSEKQVNKHARLLTPAQQQRRVFHDHATRGAVHRLQLSSAQLIELYRDVDGARAEEVAFLAGENPDGNVWTNFYDRLAEIRLQHKKSAPIGVKPLTEHSDPALFFRDVIVAGLQDETATETSMKLEQARLERVLADIAPWDSGAINLIFTGAEDRGCQVDLEPLRTDYCNLRILREIHVNDFVNTEKARIKKHAASKGNISIEEAGNKIDWASPEIQNRLVFVDVDLVQYLRTFDRFHDVPRRAKYRVTEYERYVDDLASYLAGFFYRQNPLSDAAKIRQQFDADFEHRWASGSIPEWVTPTHNLPLYCPATDCLMATEGTRTSHMNSKKYKKALTRMQSLSPEQLETRAKASEALDKHVASQEALVQRYRELLGDTIAHTVEVLQKKQSRTAWELEEAREEEYAREEEEEEESELSSDFDDADDNTPTYNPLNLPLGWDGKPIPFWLYKLHGLGQEFRCEICGNYSYWGRRAYERHFSEWRHAFGMRCLRIPNTSHFKEVTKIEDALALYDRLKRTAQVQAFSAERDAEFEDAEGNTMSLQEYMRIHGGRAPP
ncbi:MAG: uncharacterized protein KVP18_001768 [Porospora cf. gigantea A]|uniref:uncharacterized protein n=1 Tax=Porospora cf. gigantea A TaxID=2853593 RepID=UPI00355ACA29|nr:MAG: hypothetical protein KVP18_001768 [Porospora cf. gigantea A]